MCMLKIKHYKNVVKNKITTAVLRYEIENGLLSNNFKKNVLIFFRKPKRVINVLRGKEFNLRYVEIVLTTVCNLNCKGCSALMNYYKKPYHIDLDLIIKSLQRLIDSCDSVYRIRLLGGEPFCYPHLYEVLEYLSKQDKIKNVAIVTNSTFIINDARVLQILKNDKFYLSMSDYGTVSSKYEQLKNQLDENNIKYIPMNSNYEWVDYGGFDKRNRKTKDVKKQYINCTRKKMSLLDGKLFHCYRCSHASNLKLIDLRKEDYIDLLNEEINITELRKKLYKFTYKYVPFIESCNYCDCIKNSKKISRGSQMKKDTKSNQDRITL